MTTRAWHVSVVAHKGRLLLQFRDPSSRRWKQRSTGWEDTPENRARAEREARKLERELYAVQSALGNRGGPLTVDAWVKTWLERRDVRDVANDRQRLRDHVQPDIGAMLLADVQPRHIAALAKRWTDEGKAPRTRRNIYSVLKALFRDARIEGVLDGADPCILTHRQLGKIRDSKRGWRSGAVFTHEELELLISSPKVPADRRVSYALLSVGMLRLGEMAGLRWGKLERAEPLGRMVVDTTYEDELTKTGEERWMPVHPTLAAMLAEWRLSGWPAAFGRAPKDDDLVVPVPPEPKRKGRVVPPGSVRNRHWVWKRARADLAALELRHRRVHDLRRTGISLAQDDGADKAVLRWATHAPPREVFDLYTTLHWQTVCREVVKLKVARPAINLLAGRAGYWPGPGELPP